MSKKDFYLVKRKDRLTDGKATFYVRFRDESGELLPWRSTGHTARTRAENWIHAEYKAGRVGRRDNLTFGEYAEKWWKWGECDYIRGKLARGKSISRGYADERRGHLERHILPTFKNKLLSKITPQMIKGWVLALKDAPRNPKDPDSSPLSPTSVNHCLGTLKTMMKEAARLGVIQTDPSAFIEQLHEEPKEKQILSVEEMIRLFRESTIPEVWSEDVRHFTINLLAASTGLRMGEIQALQVDHVHEDYIAVVHSWGRKYGLKDPKWNSAREVPIPSKTFQYLAEVIKQSPHRDREDLLFYGTDARSPLGHKEILTAFYDALEAIEITPEERARRNITFHSWRHFFNSVCRSHVPDYKLQRLTGHKTQAMTEHYTHLKLDDFRDVVALQGKVFG